MPNVSLGDHFEEFVSRQWPMDGFRTPARWYALVCGCWKITS